MENDTIRNLIKDSTEYKVLISVLLNNAKLNWSKDGLKFDDEVVDALLRALAPETYLKKFTELYEQIAEKE